MFAAAAAGLGVVLVYGLAEIAPFGRYHGVYGLVLSGLGVSMRHATDLVTALNFDIRGFDTLGEEFILFASILGVVLILREMRDEESDPHAEEADEKTSAGASEALRVLSLVLVPSMIALGVYIVVHGALTPGGGFQGGVILAAGPLAVFLAGRYVAMKTIAPHALVEAADGIGAAAYGIIGVGGLIFVGIFFKNFLPLGTPGHILSAGQMPLASIAVALEVSGAFLVGWVEFLEQALVVEEDS
jgi:multicomponent Na+:H+ antiporter subunit B